MLSKPIHHGAWSPGEEGTCLLVCALLWKEEAGAEKASEEMMENPEDKTGVQPLSPPSLRAGKPPVFFSGPVAASLRTPFSEGSCLSFSLWAASLPPPTCLPEAGKGPAIPGR